MCVCIYICMCIYTCIYIHVCCMCVYIYVCVYVYIYICVCVHTHTCVCGLLCVFVSLWLCICILSLIINRISIVNLFTISCNVLMSNNINKWSYIFSDASWTLSSALACSEEENGAHPRSENSRGEFVWSPPRIFGYVSFF